MGFTNKEDNFMSVVAYVHNDGQDALAFVKNISEVLNKNFKKYEIILVDDASEDNGMDLIRQHAEGCGCMVQIVHMSYFQGVELAMNAGVSLAIGDFVLEFDSVQMDYEPGLIMEVYNRSLQGYDIVSAAPEGGGAVSSRLFYSLFNHFSKVKHKLRTERFRVLSRRVLNRIHSMSKTVPYRKALYMNSGLACDTLLYSPNEKQKCTLGGDIAQNVFRRRMAIDSLILFTDFGYKTAFGLSCFMLILTALLAVYTLCVYSMSIPVEGWTSTVLILCFGFCGIFSVATIIIKYLDVLMGLVFKKRTYTVESIEKLKA